MQYVLIAPLPFPCVLEVSTPLALKHWSLANANVHFSLRQTFFANALALDNKSYMEFQPDQFSAAPALDKCVAKRTRIRT